jgi:pyruvate formate lyase activating enzyme
MENDVQSAWECVKGIERFSLCDWPGVPSAVLFTGGCNLRCPTCHNAELAWRPHRLPTIFKPDLLTFLRRRALFLDGIVVTGGEPTIAPDLASMLRDIRALGLPVCVHTNGMRPDVVRELLEAGLVDVFAVDVKGPYGLYAELTGCVAGDEARTSLEAIFAMAREKPGAFRFRLTRVPILSEADVAEAEHYLPNGFSLTIQTYVPPKSRRETTDAHADSQTRRKARNVVHGPHRRSYTESLARQRDQGSAAVQATGS